jgi:alpha-amylase/alpha-mannosidase (GH57 family)
MIRSILGLKIPKLGVMSDKLLFDFSHCSNWNEVSDIVNTHIYNELNDTNVVVLICFCDEVGMYNKSELHIFNSYIDALSMINFNEYTSNAVKVYEWGNTELNVVSAEMLEKVHDVYGYSRCAGITASPIEASFWRRLYDTDASVYLH